MFVGKLSFHSGKGLRMEIDSAGSLESQAWWERRPCLRTRHKPSICVDHTKIPCVATNAFTWPWKKHPATYICLGSPKSWNLSGCFFYLQVNASICVDHTKSPCVAKQRVATVRCACCVLELLCSIDFPGFFSSTLQGFDPVPGLPNLVQGVPASPRGKRLVPHAHRLGLGS